MTRCRACDFQTDPESTFCGSCGAFLQWVTDQPGQDTATGDGVGQRGAAGPPATAGPEDDTIRLDELVPGPPWADDALYGADVVQEAPTGAADAGSGSTNGSGPSSVRPPDGVGGADHPVVPPVPGPGATPPPPPVPPPGRLDAPPPTLAERSSPEEWQPPPASVGDRPRVRVDPARLRVIARPVVPPEEVERIASALTAPNRTRRLRPVEIVLPPDLDEEPPEEPEDIDAAALGALLPGRQRTFTPPPPSVRQAPSRTPQPGDVICPRCSEANLPTRAFCRRCGLRLEVAEVAEVAVRLSWWQRLRRRLRVRRPGEERRRYRAGERPAAAARVHGESRWRVMWRSITKVGRMAFGYLVAGLAILALVGTVLPAAAPIRQEIVATLESVGARVQRALVPQYVRVYPVDVVASSSLPDYPPEAAVDSFSNRHWAEGAPGDGPGQTITFTFQEPVELARLAFINGGVPPGEEYTSQPRPRLVTVFFDNDLPTTIELRDDPAFQEHSIGRVEVLRLTLRIDSVYEAIGDGSDAALTEVEFLRRL